MRLLVLLALLPTIAVAQQSLSDQQIIQAYTICHKPENIIYTTPGLSREPSLTRQKVDYKADMKAQCEAVDAEYNKRDIAARATAIDKAQRDQLNEIANQLKGAKK